MNYENYDDQQPLKAILMKDAGNKSLEQGWLAIPAAVANLLQHFWPSPIRRLRL